MKLEILNVSKEYIKQRSVLSNVAFVVSNSEKITLMGAVDAGKTTLFRLMSKLDKGFVGEILFDGVSVRKIKQKAMDLFLLSDNLMLKENQTVLQNVCFGLILRGGTKESAKTVAMPFLEKFGLSSKINLMVETLSDYEKILVAICRGVARSPKIVILDDILVRFDEIKQLQYMKVIVKILNDFDCIVIYSVNTIPLGQSLRLRTVVLNEGKISFDGDFENSPYANVDIEDE